MSQSERTGVPTPDSADLPAGGHKTGGEDRDVLGTIKLTVKDLRRILIHGRHFPFLTPEEGETGGVGHWETRVWESCDISVWGTTRELGFPVTRDGDTVKSARDAAEGRRTNFFLSPRILRFCRQALSRDYTFQGKMCVFYYHSNLVWTNLLGHAT